MFFEAIRRYEGEEADEYWQRLGELSKSKEKHGLARIVIFDIKNDPQYLSISVHRRRDSPDYRIDGIFTYSPQTSRSTLKIMVSYSDPFANSKVAEDETLLTRILDDLEEEFSELRDHVRN